MNNFITNSNKKQLNLIQIELDKEVEELYDV
jgi:hypothetical protein